MSDNKLWIIQNSDDEDKILGVFTSKQETVNAIMLWSSIGGLSIYSIETDLEAIMLTDMNEYVDVTLDPKNNNGASGQRKLYISRWSRNNGAPLSYLR